MVRLLHNATPRLRTVVLIAVASGMRLGEVLSLRFKDIDIDETMINASEIHTGDTKSSWVSFVTRQTAEYLDSYIISDGFNLVEEYEDNTMLFSVSDRSVQQVFEQTSEMLGITLTHIFCGRFLLKNVHRLESKTSTSMPFVVVFQKEFSQTTTLTIRHMH